MQPIQGPEEISQPVNFDAVDRTFHAYDKIKEGSKSERGFYSTKTLSAVPVSQMRGATNVVDAQAQQTTRTSAVAETLQQQPHNKNPQITNNHGIASSMAVAPGHAQQQKRRAQVVRVQL